MVSADIDEPRVAKRRASAADEDDELGQPSLKRGRPDASIDLKQKEPHNALPKPPPHPRPARQIFHFGNGDMGQLGLGPDFSDEIPRPRLHAWTSVAVESGILGGPGAGIEKIYAGGMHSMAIDESGRVWTWGVDEGGALGRLTQDVPDPEDLTKTIHPSQLSTQPMMVQALADEGFRAADVVAGDSISIALSDTGAMRVWGSFRSSEGMFGFDGQPGSHHIQFLPIELPSLAKYTFVQVACGADHVLALTTQGSVYVWGDWQKGQLARRIIERRKTNALAPERLALRRCRLIGTGRYHSFAVSQAGRVFAWGLNTLGQTGINRDENAEDTVWTPIEVKALSPAKLGGGRRVVQIEGGEHQTLFLISDGSVYGCGRMDDHQLGLSDDHPAVIKMKTRNEDFISEPVLIPFPPLPTDADPDPPLAQYGEASRLPPINPIARISMGLRSSLAVSRAGHAYSWGFSGTCQLGLGRDVDLQRTPARVRSKAMNDWKVEGVSAGGQHCLLSAVPMTASDSA